MGITALGCPSILIELVTRYSKPRAIIMQYLHQFRRCQLQIGNRWQCAISPKWRAGPHLMQGKSIQQLDQDLDKGAESHHVIRRRVNNRGFLIGVRKKPDAEREGLAECPEDSRQLKAINPLGMLFSVCHTLTLQRYRGSQTLDSRVLLRRRRSR